MKCLAVIYGLVIIGSAVIMKDIAQDRYMRIGQGSIDESFLLITNTKGIDWICEESASECCTYLKIGPNNYQCEEFGVLVILD